MISSPICIQLSDREGGVVVQLMLVSHLAAKETYSSSPSFTSRRSIIKCSVVKQFLLSPLQCSVFDLLLLAAND